MIRLLFLLSLLLLVVSCSPNQEISSEELPEGFSILSHYSERNADVTSKLSSLSCDSQTGTVVFTLTNLDTKIWSLDRVLSEEEKLSQNVRLLFNDRVLNPRSDEQVLVDQETQKPFIIRLSEVCGTDLLLPKQSVTCTINELPLQEVNKLRIDAQGKDDRVTFTC